MTSSVARALRLGWWWLAAAYLAVCTAVAAVVFFTPYSSPWPFWTLVLLTLPLSGLAFLVQFAGFTLVFGVEADGWLTDMAGFLLWVGVATAQVLALRWVVRAGRPTGTAAVDGTG